MMKKVEMPKWRNLIKDNYSFKDEDRRASTIDWKGCIDWFYETIDPINRALDAAVEIKFRYMPNGDIVFSDPENKALLINVEEIKQDTAEDLLRLMIDRFHPDDYCSDKLAFDLIKRAKALLERES